MATLVKDLMIGMKEIVSQDDSVSSAVDIMVDHDVGSVIVEDDNETVVGIFTERDLLRHYRKNQSKFLYMGVSEVMSSPAITVGKETELSTAIKIMISKKRRQLPVVDADGKLVGMISWKEIIAKLSA